eukprot:ANDGO_05519.mRNA.1 fibronectin/fibrinogen binding-related protein
MVRTYRSEGEALIRVGENARDNDYVRRTARQNHLWFHLESMHSAHVVLAVAESEASRQMVEDAALLCKYWSREMRDRNAARVMYTIVKNVREGRTGNDGQVQLAKTPTVVTVHDDPSRLAVLLQSVGSEPWKESYRQ